MLIFLEEIEHLLPVDVVIRMLQQRLTRAGAAASHR
ncbi:MAG: hypothetical protein ACI83E_001660 [Sulfitobacter sp.]|jgi:hypothetical protein